MGPKRLLILSIAFCLLQEATAASVVITQNPEGPAPAALEVGDESSEFYMHEGRQCRKCPPGTQVDEHCTSDKETTCRDCDSDTFAKHLNPLKACFSCKTCRQLDEVELQPCTSTSNTQCACKNGTFCLPSLPCETCHKCTPRCPEGEQMVKPCTSTSNIECVPYTASPTPPTGGSDGSVAGVIVGSLFGFLVLLAVICWITISCCNGAKRRRSAAVVWHSKTIQCLWRNCGKRQCEEVDNARNVQIDWKSLQSSQTSTHPTSRTPETMPLQTTAQPEEESNGLTTERERELRPANGKDPVNALRQSFDIFIKEVPVKEWRRYMRALGLTEHEILRAAHSEKDLYEQEFQMLVTWLNKRGKEASLNTLLTVLCEIELRGVEGKMRTTLISHGLYVYEE